MLPGNALSLLAASAGDGSSAYQISRSLRFNASDSAYLSRAFSSAGNRKKWCYSAWVKRAALSANQWLFTVEQASTQQRFGINSSDKLTWIFQQGESAVTTTAVFRDPSAFYHIVLVSDTDNADQTLRIRIFVNGVAQATGIEGFAARWPTSGELWAINNNITHNIGRFTDTANPAIYSNYYLAETWFLDGVTPGTTTRTVNGVTETILTDFGEFDATTGVWNPKAYTSSVTGNGFHLEFADNSSNTATTLGKDTSGNGNNWTPNNLSVTTGAGNDSLVDTPTSYGTDTGVGGEVRGNYATLNPLKNNSNNVLSNGNLTVVNAASSTSLSFATIALPKSGKYYFEGLASANGGSTNVQIGVFSTDHALTQTGSKRYWYLESGTLYVDNTLAQTVATYGNSDLIGVAYNADANTVTWYKNGVQQGTAISVDTSYEYVFGAGIYRGQWDLNFGQRAFAYTAPSGFKALVDTNLPAVDPAVAKGSSAMDVVLYTGNGAARNITGLAFNPDLVWIKARSIGYDHRLADSVRGVGKELYSNNASTETTNDANGYVSAFNSDGFALQSGIGVNGSGNTYVAWTWDGGTSTVTNNSGTISSQVRANPAAGFSVVTYTGSSTNNIVGHGLGVTPALVIVKPRTTNDFWVVYHLALNDLSKYLVLSSTAAAGTASNYWGTSGNWSSTTFGVYSGGGGNNNLTNVPTVAYCWAPVAGYSSFGSYVGNGSGSNDGPFVYTGFRPKWVMVKASSSDPSGGGWWNIIDATRNTYNAATNRLGANSSSAENSSYQWMDLLSNGFKLRELLDGSNVSGVTYIYAAFAENPFQYARAR